MSRKPFEPELYDKFDTPAKDALVSYLEQQGHTIKSVKEDYYADVVSTKGSQAWIYSEAEIKAAWKAGTDWPSSWDEVRIPGRKQRLLGKYSSVTFYIFREDCKECWVVESSQLTPDRLRKATGPKIRPGEQFFHIPVKEAILIRHEANEWAQVQKAPASSENTNDAGANPKDGDPTSLPERSED